MKGIYTLLFSLIVLVMFSACNDEWKEEQFGKGALIRRSLQDFITQELDKLGYSQVYTPNIGKLDLYLSLIHIFHADDFMAFFQKPFAEVGADEAGSSGDQNPFTHDSMSMRLDVYKRQPSGHDSELDGYGRGNIAVE